MREPRKHFDYGEHSFVSDEECVPCYYALYHKDMKYCPCGESKVINGRLMCSMVNERKYELIEWGSYYPCEYKHAPQLNMFESEE